MDKVKKILCKNCIPVRCENCHIPLEGWRYKLLVKPIFKIHKHETKNLCSRCKANKIQARNS